MTARVLWHETTAIFGGTFDPPHLGHRQAIEGLFTEPAVQRVLVIPTPAPPHKTLVAPTEARLDMLRLLTSGLSNVVIDLREIIRPTQPAYTYDTLMELKRDFSRLAFVIGIDQLTKLDTWSRFPALLGLCHWIILERKPDGLARATEVLKNWESNGLIRHRTEREWDIAGGPYMIRICDTPARKISSTEIREQIARTGVPPEETIPLEILSYLKAHRIYGTSNRNAGEI